MPKQPRTTVLLAVAAAMLLAAPAQSTVGPGYQILRDVNVAPGLNYKEVKDSRGPNRIHLLTINPEKAVSIDVAMPKGQLGHTEKTSSMAARRRATAAINGDFGAGAGRPTHGFMVDGSLKLSPGCCPRGFAIRRNEAATYFGVPEFTAGLHELDSNEHWAIDRWNRGSPDAGEIAAFTPDGGTFAAPPQNACSARLLATSGLVWSNGGLARAYRVEETRCGDRLSADRGVVLSAKPGTPEGDEVATLEPGETVRLDWKFGWAGIMDFIGGKPILMKDGVVTADSCSEPLCRRQARTGIGRRSDGRLLLIVVDGGSKQSVGMTLIEFASLFKDLGATDALNLQGGASSTMVVKGSVVNRPSTGSERAVANSLLVLPRPDPGEPQPASGF